MVSLSNHEDAGIGGTGLVLRQAQDCLFVLWFNAG